jgi:hypothetical protein
VSGAAGRPSQWLAATLDDAWTPATALLAAIADGLAARGASIGVLVRDGTPAAARLVARAAARCGGAEPVLLRGDGRWALTRGARAVAARLQPSAWLVQDERTLRLALAARGDAGVVRRLAVGERPPAPGWRDRATARKVRLVLLTHAPEPIAFPATARIRIPLAVPPAAPPSSRRRPGARAAPAGVHVVLVPAMPEDAATACALRALSRLAARDPGMRLTLVGAPDALQPIQVHAAALGLAAGRATVYPEAFVDGEPVPADLAWVTDPGEAGALAVVGAMARGLPVVAPQGTPPAALAGDGACGLHVGDDPAMAASAVARLLGAPARRAALARAAAERAARDHDWTVLLDRVQDALARAAGQPRVRGGEALAVAPAGASPSLHAP